MNEETLKAALSLALRVIENYEMDIRNWDNGRLVREGFCQGTIYLTARDMIERARDGKFKP